MSKTNSDFNNKVWKENNFVYFIIADKVNDIEAKRLKDTGTKLVEEIMKQTGLKSLVMIDIEKASYFSAKARNDWVEFLRLPNIHKTAIYG
ncbi:hypothetical protein A2476_01855 [candidate division CPR3 bacterium RIFOXYC2_FULL_35_7]|nr:MAG: hypothetical protein A2476_01855 [candidate division CPR3 bacterium RIFOXYC2_FULL_35_7]